MKKKGNISILQKMCFAATIGFMFAFIFACSDSKGNSDGWDEPYDSSRPVKLSTFYPDSGGMATNVIIEGTNFGTDPQAVRVYYNKKRAAVVSARGTKLYVITPRLPGDTCEISVVVGKDSLVFDNTFEYTSVTRVTTISGNPDVNKVVDGTLISAGFEDPRYLTVDGDDNIFVCEFSNKVIRRVNIEKNEVTSLKFTGGNPNAPAVDAQGKVMIVPMDAGKTFYEFDPERLWDEKKFDVVQADDSKPFSSQWKHGVSTCMVDEMMYYRSYAGEIIKFDPKTKKGWLVDVNIASGSDGWGVFSPLEPTKLFMSYAGHRYISYYDVKENKYVEYTGKGQMGHVDGALEDAGFGKLQQICFDLDGNLFVADAGSHCIRKISPEGVVSTVVGLPGKKGYKDGDPEVAMFNDPSGVAVDSEGTIYIADRGNNCIRKLSIE